jgi:hypothetical protein
MTQSTAPANSNELATPIDGLANQNRGGAAMSLPLPTGSRLSLKQAIAIALKYHPKAAQAAAESGAAQERIGEARSYLGSQLYGISEYLRATGNGISNTNYYNWNGILPRITGTNHDLPPSDTSQSSDTSNSYMGGRWWRSTCLISVAGAGLVAERHFEAGAGAAR